MPDLELILGELAIGIRCTTTAEKIVGKHDLVPEIGSFGKRGPVDAVTIVDDVLTALRLFKQGDLECPGEVSLIEPWLFNAGYQARFRAWHPFMSSNYELRDIEVEELQNMWSDLTTGTLDERAFLAMALRRFNMAFERRQLDDRVVVEESETSVAFLEPARHRRFCPPPRGFLCRGAQHAPSTLGVPGTNTGRDVLRNGARRAG